MRAYIISLFLIILTASDRIWAGDQHYYINLKLKSSELYFKNDQFGQFGFYFVDLYNVLPALDVKINKLISVEYQFNKKRYYWTYEPGFINTFKIGERTEKPARLEMLYHTLSVEYHLYPFKRVELCALTGLVYRKYTYWDRLVQNTFEYPLAPYPEETSLGVSLGTSAGWRFTKSQRYSVGLFGVYHLLEEFDTWSFGVFLNVGIVKINDTLDISPR